MVSILFARGILKYAKSGAVTLAIIKGLEEALAGGQFNEVTNLAEIISQYLTKGSKAYVEGRLSNRSWKDQQGQIHYITEIVADELILLDSKKTIQQSAQVVMDNPPEPEPTKTESEEPGLPRPDEKDEEIDLDDIPF